MSWSRRERPPRRETRVVEINCPDDHNILSCILIKFIETYRDSEVDLPQYSRAVSEWLAERFEGFNMRLHAAYAYIEMLKTTLETEERKVAGKSQGGVKALLRYDFALQTPLTIHTRWPYMPLEIGLAWHPVLDLPYIPGSSIKGAARAYAEINNLPCAEIFGTTEESGDVVFFDAFPIDLSEKGGGKISLITLDVLTPHYHRDLMAEHSVAPTPLVFPVVAPNVKFTFLVWLREIKKEHADCAYQSIKGALEHGLGAKVSLGYGIFRQT